jgi:hypothetical protein
VAFRISTCGRAIRAVQAMYAGFAIRVAAFRRRGRPTNGKIAECVARAGSDRGARRDIAFDYAGRPMPFVPGRDRITRPNSPQRAQVPLAVSKPSRRPRPSVAIVTRALGSTSEDAMQ